MDVGELSERYQNAGFGRTLPRGLRPAVIVVDFTRGFTDPAYPTGADMSSAVGATADVLEAARGAGVPVVFTAIAYGTAADGGRWLTKAPGLADLRLGSPLVELDSRLDRRPEDVVVMKTGPSAFFGTSLASVLVSQRVDTLIVTGATTSGCVRATVVDAMSYGWPTLVPRECVADRAVEPHEASLFDMDQKYADVIEVRDAVGYLDDLPARGDR